MPTTTATIRQDLLPPPTARQHRRRLWRTVYACLAYLLILLAIRLWWGHVADTRLQQHIDQRRAAGQLVTTEDIEALTADIDDEDNAGIELREALRKMVPWTHPDFMHSELVASPTLRALHQDVIARHLAANQQTLALVRAARNKGRIAWGDPLKSPLLLNWPFNRYAEQRELSRLLTLAALHDLDSGRHADALGRIEDVLLLGDRVSLDPPFLIDVLIGTAINAIGLSAIEPVIPRLCVEPPEVSNSPDLLCTSRTQAERMLALLLDERVYRESWLHAWEGEHVFTLDCGALLCEKPSSVFGMGTVPGAGVGTAVARYVAAIDYLAPAMQPACKIDTLAVLSAYSEMLAACAAENFQSALSGLPPRSQPSGEPSHIIAHPLTNFTDITSTSAVHICFWTLTSRRLAATALALRLYELDHGQRPATLDELVPNYLPHIPRDPFSADNRPLGYLPNADPPILYSVGPDGVDNAGEFTRNTFGGVGGDSPDLPFFLNGDRPARDRTE